MEEQNNINQMNNLVEKHTPIYIWIIMVVLIIALLVIGGLYFWQTNNDNMLRQGMQSQISSLKNDASQLQQKNSDLTNNLQQAEKTAHDNLSMANSHKSLVEYYEMMSSSTTPLVKDFVEKTPEQIGLKEIFKVKVACPPNPDGPCGSDLVIFSKEDLHPGNQEFYLASAGGAGYTYFGPFNDDLTRLMHEASLIDSLKENHN